jgi:murein DD-endopeptidase MepM/ murein hydrolase activator NlpD
MRKPINAWFTRLVTLLVLPSDSARTYRLRVPAGVLVLLGAAWIASIGAVALLLTRDIHYGAMRLLNRHLADQNEAYARDVAKVEALAKRLTPLEHELKHLIARSRRSAAEGVGEGGPNADGAWHTPFLPEEIPGRVSRLVAAGDDIFREYQDLASLATATPQGWPVRGWITSEFGERTSPYTGEVGTLHQGVDIANKPGTPVVATAGGVVLHAGWTSGGYGKMVLISHGYGYATLYGHFSRLKVSPGQRVRQGDVIGYMGSTGNATGPHCHYEVRLYGVPVSPRAFMK